MREKLIKILRTPIFPHELADPTEAVADYLLDNDVVPVVRCKDCIYNEKSSCMFSAFANPHYRPDYFCADGERIDNG